MIVLAASVVVEVATQGGWGFSPNPTVRSEQFAKVVLYAAVALAGYWLCECAPEGTEETR